MKIWAIYSKIGNINKNSTQLVCLRHSSAFLILPLTRVLLGDFLPQMVERIRTLKLFKPKKLIEICLKKVPSCPFLLHMPSLEMGPRAFNRLRVYFLVLRIDEVLAMVELK